MTTVEPIVDTESAQLALGFELMVSESDTLEKPSDPNFPTLAALRAHLRTVDASDWADNPTLTQSVSRRLAVIRPEGDYGWLLIAPGPALYLHNVSRCDSRKQALVLCEAIEEHIDLAWDQPGTGPQLGAWRSAAGEGLWGTIVRLRGSDRALDTTTGLYAGIAATHSEADDEQGADGEPDTGADPADELELSVPAEQTDAASPFSRAWGHCFDGADLHPQPRPLPPTPRQSHFWHFCAGCSETFITVYPIGGGNHAHQHHFCPRCLPAHQARFNPQPGDAVRLLDPTSFSKYLIQSIDGDMVKLRLLGAPDKAPFSVHIGELDPVNSPFSGRKDPKGAA